MSTSRKMTIIAQDPSVKNEKGRILKTQVSIPYEQLGPGPRGYRVFVVDYDSSQRVFYSPFEPDEEDQFLNASDKKLCSEPGFHAQNVYAIIMRLLSRFEKALGRRVGWGFGGHQLHVSPHAFEGANAYYSDESRGLFFGYFSGVSGDNIFTCLSHDVIAHETTHALIDGLRTNYTLPSHPDQAGFHEGFSDIVSLLSVFGLKDVVRSLIPKTTSGSNYVKKSELTISKMQNSILMGLAEQFGQEASRYRVDCLRRSVEKPAKRSAYKDVNFEESHYRGEILSAAVLNSFLHVWRARLATWLPVTDQKVLVDRIVEDGIDAAEQLLTMCIRALDYCPAVDISYGDFLSALLTADYELLQDDGKYKYRNVLRDQFAKWGIDPSSLNVEDTIEKGIWEQPENVEALRYDCVHRESLERNPDEIYRFLWENRKVLGIYEDAYTWIITVRPCIRVGPDGFVLNETVSEYRQTIELKAGNLFAVHPKMTKPEGMPDDTIIRLNGGGVFIFDEFGHLKYHIRSRINNPISQNERLGYLWRNRIRDSRGRYGITHGPTKGLPFAKMHAYRDGTEYKLGEWDG